MALSNKERESIERDARLDQKDGEDRKYKGDTLTDVVFAPLDLLTGTQSTTEHAQEKQAYYDDCKESLDKR
jgi:hypothetical protein